jgi:RimJ/RimL family protein N-acetyltransferase
MSAYATDLRPLSLRRADEADVELVHSWNNASEVRAMSRDSRPIEMTSHRAWFSARIASRDPFWIIEEYGAPVGVVRVDRRGDHCLISIALGRTARGRGIGRFAIQAACAYVRGPVIAEVRADNLASRICFTRCGFSLVSDDGELATYRWTPEA